jgi:hypothetical protein
VNGRGGLEASGTDGDEALSVRQVLHVLSHGEIEIRGRLAWSSNATFLVVVRPPGKLPSARPGRGPTPLAAIYKPAKGERPLWDFPRGLWKREVAAYRLDAHLGWGLVPPTTARADAPLGAGSLQYCVDAVPDEHYFTLQDDPAHGGALRKIAAFDLVANNADRKAGHCLVDHEGRLWAIDHGLCFHAQPKLRTVLWDFIAEEIDGAVLADFAGLAHGEVPRAVADMLSVEEIGALVTRAETVVSTGRYPRPTTEYPYPWPLV